MTTDIISMWETDIKKAEGIYHRKTHQVQLVVTSLKGRADGFVMEQGVARLRHAR